MGKGERLPFGPVDQARALINNRDLGLFPLDQAHDLDRHIQVLRRLVDKPSHTEGELLKIRQTLWWHRDILERMGYDAGEYPFMTGCDEEKSDGEFGI